MNKIKLTTLASASELQNRNKFHELYAGSPIPDNEQLASIALFLKRQDLMKILFFNEIYKQIVNVHGIIIEFGCRWGQNLVTLSNLRSIYEPYNYNRRIVGFDTFEGFKNTGNKDGKDEIILEGALSTTNNYNEYLEQVLTFQQNESPLNHIKKSEIIKGDATEELEKYLAQHPETIIAFAWFDFDIYQPTYRCLELIKNHVTKGTIIGFDELNDPKFPGETIALKESLGLENVELKRNGFSAMQSYLTIK